MATASAGMWLDANRNPIQWNGLVATTSKTLVANNTTATVPIFKITGTIEVIGLYGVVTTVLGANHTAASFRINDQTAQIYLTLLAGTAASAAPVGSLIIKSGLVATAVTLKSSAAGAILEASGASLSPFTSVIITQKTGGIETDIEYKYTTTETPTTGVIQFFCEYLPVSSDGNVTAL
jgi:hypothetical protein